MVQLRGSKDGCPIVTPPLLPSGVLNISEIFYKCKSLTSAPTIPNGVTTISKAFGNCTSLRTGTNIPASVQYMSATFHNCTSLSGNIVIDASPTSSSSYASFFQSCGADAAHTITLRGSSTLLNEIAATGGSYVVVGE